MANLSKLHELNLIVLQEYTRADALYPSFHSAHEGFAIILEEVDELKAEVWKSPKNRDLEAMKTEAIQVAAMALRFLMDVIPTPVLDEMDRLLERLKTFEGLKGYLKSAREYVFHNREGYDMYEALEVIWVLNEAEEAILRETCTT